MWKGGVRVTIFDDQDRLLMVKHVHPEREVWMVPGGAIEEDESSRAAAAREVLEETGLEVEVQSLFWHVEEVSERGQRFVNYYKAKVTGGELGLGADPEFGEDEQVLKDIRYVSREEMAQLEHVYPNALREELWEMYDAGELEQDAYRVREERPTIRPHLKV